MNFKQFTKAFLTIAFALCAALVNVAAQEVDRTADLTGENVVVRWNRVLRETVSTPGQHPATIMPVRSYAIMHAAMFDAVNSIDGGYTPYLTDGQHHILDAKLGEIDDPAKLASALLAIPGVVDHGLFIGIADAAYIAGEGGVVRLEAARRTS